MSYSDSIDALSRSRPRPKASRTLKKRYIKALDVPVLSNINQQTAPVQRRYSRTNFHTNSAQLNSFSKPNQNFKIYSKIAIIALLPILVYAAPAELANGFVDVTSLTWNCNPSQPQTPGTPAQPKLPAPEVNKDCVAAVNDLPSQYDGSAGTAQANSVNGACSMAVSGLPTQATVQRQQVYMQQIQVHMTLDLVNLAAELIATTYASCLENGGEAAAQHQINIAQGTGAPQYVIITVNYLITAETS